MTKNKAQNKIAKPVNKYKWILKQSKRLTPLEVVARAKEQGIAMSAAYVSATRSAAKRKSGAPMDARGRKRGSVNAEPIGAKVPRKPIAEVRREFVEHAARLGVDAARALLDKAASKPVALPAAKTAAKPTAAGVATKSNGHAPMVQA